MDIRKLQRAIVDGLEDVKAQDILVFNTEHLSPLFERVIVASGQSNRQTKALASSVREAVKSRGMGVLSTQGEDNGEWIIVDCGAAVVHVMQPSIREYYRLEEIWGGKPVKIKLGEAKGGLVKASEPMDDDEDDVAPVVAKAKKPVAAKKAVAQKRVVAPKPATPQPGTVAGKKALAAKALAAKTPAAKKAAAGKVVAKKAAPAAKTAAAKAPARKTAPAKAPAAKTVAAKAPAAKKVRATVEKKIVVPAPASRSAKPAAKSAGKAPGKAAAGQAAARKAKAAPKR